MQSPKYPNDDDNPSGRKGSEEEFVLYTLSEPGICWWANAAVFIAVRLDCLKVHAGLKMVVIGDWSEFISFKSYLGSSPWSVKGLKSIATTCVVISFPWAPCITYFILAT